VTPNTGGAPIPLPDGGSICWADPAADQPTISPAYMAILLSPKPQPHEFSEPALFCDSPLESRQIQADES
jgi:hypothetical protein